jgi:hypothetical protein
VHDQIASAERHAAAERAETDRLYGELVTVMRDLGRARRRQFCLQSPLACVADRLRRLLPGRRHG